MQKRFSIAVTGQSLIKHDVRAIRLPEFSKIAALLQNADLAFTNFESTILGSHGGWPLKGSFFGCSQAVVLDALQEMGFGALALSNNHAFDLGPSGVLSTLDEVNRRAFLHAGLGRTHDEAARANTATIGARRIALVAMDGGPGPDFMYAANAGIDRPERPGVNRLRLSQVIEVDNTAFELLGALRDKIGYNGMDLANDSQPDDPPRVDDQNEIAIARAVFKRSNAFGRSVKVDDQDMTRNLASISAAAEEGSLVIAYLHHHHWAADWYQIPGWVSSVARRCIDAGASMFVSHGAPVLQPVEIYRRKPIFYSLGNFIFHVRSEKSSWIAREVWESVVGLCSFDDRGDLAGISFSPIIIGGENALKEEALEQRLVPLLATGSSADRILHRFRDQSEALGTVIEVADGLATLRL